MKDKDSEIDDITEHLEQSSEELEQDQEHNQWEDAHEKYDNGNHQMLENLLNAKSKLHEQNTLAHLRKKGVNLNYDKLDTSLLGIILTSSSFIIHPVIISGWLTIFYKITADSMRNIETGNKWERLDDFGLELIYFVASTIATIYFFMVVQDQSIVLEKGGTFMQILVEVVNLVR